MTGELGKKVGPGTFGENVTTRGLDLGAALIGERWCVGSATLEVSQPRMPCFKLGFYYGDHVRAGLLLRAPQLSESWRAWAEKARA